MGFIKDLTVSGKAGALAALAGLALGAYAWFHPSAVQFCVSRVTFYCMLALFACWAAALARRLPPGFDGRAFLKEYGAGLLFSLALTVFIFLSVKPQFRVLSDETNLLAVSKSMLFERRADNVTMGKWYYFNFQPLLRETEKRPYMFPFFTSLVGAVRRSMLGTPCPLRSQATRIRRPARSTSLITAATKGSRRWLPSASRTSSTSCAPDLTSSATRPSRSSSTWRPPPAWS